MSPDTITATLKYSLAQAIAAERQARTWFECCQLMGAGEEFAGRRYERAVKYRREIAAKLRLLEIEREEAARRDDEHEQLRAELSARVARFAQEFAS